MIAIRKGVIRVMRRTVVIFGLCLLVILPSAGWALDGKDDWRNLSPQEKEHVIRNYQRWQNLPPQNKEHLREEWDRWQRLPQDSRDKLKRRYEEQRHDRSRD
jgi:Protein of unknown function (DUF3106)